MNPTTMDNATRYALYFVPAQGSQWRQFGEDWFARIPEAPRRYGFHATLKAPFRLAEGVSAAQLLDELAQYCRTLQPITLPPLKITLLDDFLALVPVQAEQRVDAIAAECVMRFDRFRAPLDDADLARRRPERLDRGELDLLQHWGYPYVLDLFRFHLSLTGPLGDAGPARAAALSVDAGRMISNLAPVVMDAICVYREQRPGAEFSLLERVEFGVQAG